MGLMTEIFGGLYFQKVQKDKTLILTKPYLETDLFCD